MNLELDSYARFLENKSISFCGQGLDVITELNSHLFPFQQDIVRWALKLGKSALFAGCGLGKSLMSLSWADEVINQTSGRVIMVTPLSVGYQMERESAKFGIKARFTKKPDLYEDDRIVITNYENLDKFSAVDFVGVVLDESSIIKHSSSKMRGQIIDMFKHIDYRLACTATPSPNDYMELGNHAEFVGVMSQTEMLATFFTHDGGNTSKWRLKGHAVDEFWKWVSSWACTVEKPSDLGYANEGYDLPLLHYHDHVIDVVMDADDGQLLKTEATGLMERRQARRESINLRVSKCAELVNASDEQWLVWCDLNDEGDMLAGAIDGAVQIAGRHSDDYKECEMEKFINGSTRVIVSKSSIAGFGLNLQHCRNMAFVGLSDSYESLHQAVRRCWRFGQEKEVNCHIITASSEGAVVRNIKRKEADAKKMTEQMIAHINVNQELGATSRQSDDYNRDFATGDGWELHMGDCVDVARGIADNSIDYIISSPPFASLYTYSNSNRDMGNSKTYDEFAAHYEFLLAELYRVLKPGRLVSFHCMNLPSSKQHDGFIGIKDFRGDLIRSHQNAGFIFHSEVVIWKDPVVAMQRTKAIGLLHKQLKKDSAMSRQGIPDYLVTMRKPGVNEYPVTGKLEYYAGDDESMPSDRSGHIDERRSIDIWQRYASPVWMDINPSKTLQRESARADDDERHICPLQLEVIERCLQLWTNPGDLVLDPFNGIGSSGYVALQSGRRYIGSELKPSYFDQARLNLQKAADSKNQLSLFDLV